MPTKVKKRAAAAVAGKNGYSLISDDKFKQIYAAMLKHRLIEQRLDLAHANGSRPDLTAGAVGVVLHLQTQDTVVLTRRHLATNSVKGVPAQALLKHAQTDEALHHAAVHAHTLGAAHTGEPMGLATGLALANKVQQNGRIAVVFVEGGPKELEACIEALELASAHALPILYVVEKDLSQKHADLWERLAELFPVITVDAHDVVAVYRVAQESTTRVREGGGPAMIACMPYRLDGPEVDSVTGMERYLTRKGLFNEEWKREVIAGIEEELGSLSS
jgi:TPP-dependent pyruvate/acetoin dehydrogenase alpha subunit